MSVYIRVFYIPRRHSPTQCASTIGAPRSAWMVSFESFDPSRPGWIALSTGTSRLTS